MAHRLVLDAPAAIEFEANIFGDLINESAGKRFP